MQLMQLPQFFDLLKSLDSADPSQLPNLVNDIKKTLYSYATDFSKFAPALHKTAEQIMRSKDVRNQCVPFYEDLICEIIKITSQNQFMVGVEALRVVFNLYSQYYKGSNLDSTLIYPIGKDRPLKNYLPKVGQQCDIVRPYITSTSQCGWTRCKVVQIQNNNKYTIKYANTKDQPSSRQKPWFAPLGTRMKDYDWRMSLDVGSPIQALLNRVWYKSTVAEVTQQNQCKKVRVTFRRFAEDGDKVDSFGIRFFGLSSGQDQWIDVLSPRIQSCGKMVNKKLCYYSFNAQQVIYEDLYDILFEQEYKQKPFYAIARSLNCKSLSLLKYINVFVESNGIQKICKLMQNTQITDDRPFLAISLLGVIVQHLPRMYLKESGLQNIFYKIPYYYQAVAKYLTVPKIDCCYYAFDNIGRRMFSLGQMHYHLNQSRKFLVREFLKMNMEKQMLALRYLNQLVNPKKPYTQSEKEVFNKFLKDQKIFSQLFNANTHQQIISRGGSILQYMIKNQIIDQKQFETLWTIVPVTDKRGRSTIEKLLGQIANNLPINFVQALTLKFLSLKQTQLTLDNLNLLRLLKNRQISNELQMNVLNYLWNVLTVKSANIKTVIEQQVEKVFKSFVSTLKDHKIRMNVLQSMCVKLNQCKKVKNQIQFLKDYIKSYPQKRQNQAKLTQMIDESEIRPPQTMFEAVSFLKSKEVYPGLLNLLFNSKDEAVKKDILQFISFLFEYDHEDINEIIRKIYQKIGPSSNFLEWVNKLLPRSTQFVTQLLQKTTDFSAYQQINTTGYSAIQNMIIDVNAQNKGIKIILTPNIKSQNTNSVGVGPTTPAPIGPSLPGPIGPITGDAGTTTNQTGKQNKMIGPQLPPDNTKHIFVLVSPFKLIGMKFLQNLLPVVKQASVYNLIVQTIVGLVTSLDESIQEKTQEYRKEFLFGIMDAIKEIIKQNKCDDKIKTRLQIYIFIISQILAKTEQNGIGNVEPYFTKVQGQKLKLQVENLFEKQKQKKYKGPLPNFELQVNENATLWKLKQIVGEIVKQHPSRVDIIKYTDPIKDINNSKSLSQMMFFNNQKIKTSKKPNRFIPKGALLNNEGTDLSEKFQRVVQGYYNQYKNSNVDGLKKEDMDKLCQEKWRGTLFREKGSLQKFYEQYDKQNKGYLNYNEFKRFFIQKSAKNSNAVWRLINLSGIINNFKKSGSLEIPEQIKSQTLPRKILSNPSIYSLIFEILQNQTFKDVHLNFYKFLCLLQVDHNEIQQIQHKIFEIIQKQKSAYALCYSLEVITSELSKKSDFYFQFWKKDGIKAIQKRLTEILSQKPTIYEHDLLLKNQIIPAFIRILNLYSSQLLWAKKLVRFVNHNKLNYLQTKQFVTKVNQMKGQNQDPNLQTEASKKLKQLGSVDQNLFIIYKVASSIFSLLIKGYVNDKIDFLSKLTFETVRILGALISTKYHEFNPLDNLYGITNLSLNNRRSMILFIFIGLFYSQEQNNKIIQQVLQKLLQNIPCQNKVQNYNFFELLREIVAKYIQISKDDKSKDQFFITIGNRLLNKLFTDVQAEDRGQAVSNKIILGILDTLEALIQKQSVCHGLSWRVIQITQKCLFAYKIEQKLHQLKVTQQMLVTEKQKQHFSNYVICKTQQTRAIAYNIVSKMHKVSPGIEPMFIDNYILPIIKAIKTQVRICSEKTSKVGLKNFGSTCYMNSMLQVLNSVGPFRNSLMRCQSEVPLIVQLKRLFAGLFFSQKIDYAPGNLLNAFVPPINPGIQQDTTQFLNLLFDQLQSGLSQTNYKRLLDEIFKGANTVQMICHSCGYKKQNRQQFFCFGVQIDGKYDLHSALEGSYQGQIISDYLCDSCKNRGQTTKRNVLSEIPNVLFIHLRRIVFNYDMFVNMKIHTRLQFPEQLNIQPYTKEGVELRQKLGLEYMKNLSHNEEQMKKFQVMAQHQKQKDFYKLKLKGVIVHSGSADVGHYYSILPDQKNWRKFDDSRITFFPMSGFESQCYGGTFTSEQWGSGSSGNAYVLIYEKQVKNPIKIQLQMDGPSQIKYNDIKVYNSPQDYGYFWLDNHYFMLQTHLLSQNHAKAFIKFATEIINDCPSQVNKIQLVSEIIYRLSFHSGVVGDLFKIVSENIKQIKPSTFYWYITADKPRTFRLLFNFEKPVRQFMANFIHTVLIQSYKKGEQKVRNDVVAYINQLLGSMTGQVAKNWLRADGYFFLLWLLINSSINIPELWYLFQERRFISTLIDYVMEKQSPVRINPKNYSLGTKTNPMDFSSCINIISLYLKHSYGLTGKNYQTPAVPEHLLFHLNDNDVICLSHIQFYKKMLRERQNLYQLAAIIQRLCILNIQFSKAIIQAVLQAICTITDQKDQMQDLANICLQILKIRDDFWIQRAEYILGVGSPCTYGNNLMSSLDEERYAFASTLYDIFPVECLLSYSYLYRLKNTTACFYLVKAVIQGCSVSDQAMKYLARQPSPCYLYESYVNWAENFITSFIPYVTNDEKVVARLKSQVQNLMKYVEDLKVFKATHPDINYYKPLIAGQIFNKKQVQSFQKDGLQIKIYEFQTYCLPSKTLLTGGNAAMDPHLQYYRLNKQVTKDSNILKFFKKPVKAITLKTGSNDQEDKQISQLIQKQVQTQNTQPIITEKTDNNDKKQQAVINGVQVIEQQVNLQGMFVNNYYRQLQITNKAKDKKYVTTQFSTDPNPNFNIPKQLSSKLFHKNSETFWIAKQDVSKDWGKLEYRIHIQEYVKQKHQKKQITSWWFKMYGDRDVNTNDVSEIIDQKIQNQPRQEGPKVDMTKDMDMTQIPCPVCTFYNLIANQNCEICGSPLN